MVAGGPPETVDDYEWMKQNEMENEKGKGHGLAAMVRVVH